MKENLMFLKLSEFKVTYGRLLIKIVCFVRDMLISEQPGH